MEQTHPTNSFEEIVRVRVTFVLHLIVNKFNQVQICFFFYAKIPVKLEDSYFDVTAKPMYALLGTSAIAVATPVDTLIL